MLTFFLFTLSLVLLLLSIMPPSTARPEYALADYAPPAGDPPVHRLTEWAIERYKRFLRLYALALLNRFRLAIAWLLDADQVDAQHVRQIRNTLAFGRGMLHG